MCETGDNDAPKASFPGEHPTWTFTFEPFDGGTALAMRAGRHAKAPVVGRIVGRDKAREHGSTAEQRLETVKNRVEPAAAREVTDLPPQAAITEGRAYPVSSNP